MNISTNVNFLLGLQTQLKVFHWQTNVFSRHEAFGKIYDEIDGLIDDFVEQAMGKYGRFKLDDETKTVTLTNLDEMNIKGFLDTVADALVQFTDILDEKDTNLLNIRDEILGLIYKLSYLLTLKK